MVEHCSDKAGAGSSILPLGTSNSGSGNKMERNYHLNLAKSDGAYTCDGCDSDIPAGAGFVNGIVSCCGSGCVRILCFRCIDNINEAIGKERTIMINIPMFAGELYTTYCEAVGGKAFNGDPLPSWEQFQTDPTKEKQVKAWLAVAADAHSKLLGCHNAEGEIVYNSPNPLEDN